MIDTPRLLIRPEEPKDAEALQRLLADPTGRQYTGGTKSFSIDKVKTTLIERKGKLSVDWEKIKSGEGHFFCTVELKNSNEYIGYCL